MKKRIVGLLVCCIMIIGLLPVTVFADDNIPITSLDFTVHDYESGNEAKDVTVTTDNEEIEWLTEFSQAFTICTEIGDPQTVDWSVVDKNHVLEKDKTYYIAVLISHKSGYSANELKPENITFSFSDGTTIKAKEIYAFGPQGVELHIAVAELPVLTDFTTTVIPFQKVVKVNGDKMPGTQEFMLDVFWVGNGNDEEYEDVEVNAVIDTEGEGTFEGGIEISGPMAQVKAFLSEGFMVRERTGNAAGWTYSDEVWYVSYAEADETSPYGSVKYYKAYPSTDPDVEYEIDFDEPYETMSFENIYTVNEETTTPEETTTQSVTPKTGDRNNLVLWIVIIVIAAIVVVVATIVARKKRTKGR